MKAPLQSTSSEPAPPELCHHPDGHRHGENTGDGAPPPEKSGEITTACSEGGRKVDREGGAKQEREEEAEESGA